MTDARYPETPERLSEDRWSYRGHHIARAAYGAEGPTVWLVEEHRAARTYATAIDARAAVEACCDDRVVESCGA